MCVAPSVVEEGLAAVEPEHPARRPDPPGEQDRGVAEAAADVDRPVAGVHREAGKDQRAVVAQAIDEDVLPAHELGHHDLVPEDHVLTVPPHLRIGRRRRHSPLLPRSA